jgi:hypothetical protein
VKGPFDFLLVEEETFYRPPRTVNGRFAWTKDVDTPQHNYYRCVGCRQIRPFSNGGAGGGLIDVVCDECWCATMKNLERTCMAITVRGKR